MASKARRGTLALPELPELLGLPELLELKGLRVLVGLPDTVWFPEDALRALPDDRLSFLLFPVDHPERFDAVSADDEGRVREIQVKQPSPRSMWGVLHPRGAPTRRRRRSWRSGQCFFDQFPRKQQEQKSG